MKLYRYIPSFGEAWALAIAALIGVVLYFGIMGWASWVPWSAEQKVPVLEAENAQLTDDKLVASSQSGLDRSIAGAAQSTLTIRIQEQARTDEYIRQIEAAPDAATRQRVLLEFLCGDAAYATDPVCQPGAQSSGLRD